MSGLPQITIVGTLTGDPELKMLPSGIAVATVNIAANERKYDRNTSQYVDGDVTFLRGTIWRDYGEHVAESLRKGDRVIATGRLRQESWEKDGQKRTTFKLDIDEIGPSLRFVNAPTSRNGAGKAMAAAAATGTGWGESDEPAW